MPSKVKPKDEAAATLAAATLRKAYACANADRLKLLSPSKFDGSVPSILYHWNGTIWKAATTKSSFYFPLLFWVVVVIGREVPEIGRHLPVFDPTDFSKISLVGTFVGFFILFYTNQCYARWWESYNVSMSIEGRIYDTTAMSRACLGRENKYAAQIVRYANLMHLLGYVGLSDEYDDNFFAVIATDLNLCSQKEMNALMAIGPAGAGGRCYREVMVWGMKSISQAKKEGSLTPEESVYMQNQFARLRGSIATLFDFQSQPVPFMYWNMANWMIIIYLPIFDYAIAQTVETIYFSAFVVLLHNVCFQGLLEIACRFLYPYGTDIEDLAVYEFITSSAHGSLAQFKGDDCQDDEYREQYLGCSSPTFAEK